MCLFCHSKLYYERRFRYSCEEVVIENLIDRFIRVKCKSSGLIRVAKTQIRNLDWIWLLIV